MSATPTGLVGPLTKVERSKKHIADLQAAIKRFLDSRPYVVGVKEDAKAGKRIYYLSGVTNPDPEVAAIIGDVLQNLRSALDHLAYQVVSVGIGGVPSRPWEIEYPVADSATEYPSLRNRKVKGARQDALDAIDATKPYKGGNDTLWRLHKLNNVDKHRLLITVGSNFRSADIGTVMTAQWKKAFPDKPAPAISLFVNVADRMFPLKVGNELFIDSIENEVHEKMQFRFDVAFGELGVMEGEPILETLQQMADLVDGIVRSFASVV